MNKKNSRAFESLKRLLEIIEKLRAPDGCLWDKKQKKEDIAKYVLEETYELIDAIESGSPKSQKEEMGDLLFQILFLSRISEEADEFNISDVMECVAEKMIRRHPHVFGDAKVKNIEEIKANWDDIKKNLENRNAGSAGLLDRIPRSLPALLRAQKLTEKASRVGFDWTNTEAVLEKLEEELHEFKASLKSNNIHYIREEIGDLLFSLVNVCRFVDVNAEEALKASVAKFTERFEYIEKKLTEEGKDLVGATLKEMDDLWNEAKQKER
jgi:tetrapyrrole methylase family protein/MazG family protein